ncbi:hypothetical protein B0T17DRAFT_507998 [Bombardia bombarda]|uniref:FAD-binding PCMH-type domain-containing protein n=1 Tax=Bombardia bombarda TaxID=252184 RepID=A0AA39X0F8_9PEZI|nr:hypothetical protein B0T17DRAFT_507998 [Bombardia bombarda]
MHFFTAALTTAALLDAAQGANLANAPFESIQLTPSDIGKFSALQFGDLKQQAAQQSFRTNCRAFPGSSDWPTDAEWKQLNVSLGSALLRPIPVAAACYQGDFYNATTCQFLVQQAGRTHFWIDDPLTVLTQWPQGSTCMPVLDAVGNCTRGGFPEYVVNATTVKHIQAAINFARNKNLRLIIKNTGHDFGGRSMGAGSLSIWVHNLKSFEFQPNYTSDIYNGMAVRIGAGLESWEHFNHMGESGNISVVAPGGGTVGAVGGWLSAGGHGSLTSKYGLGADQALSINIVTADGRFLTADTKKNKDLFWAVRGGGPSTFGVITSVIMKARPAINITSIPLSFAINMPTPLPANLTFPPNPNTITTAATPDAFWAGINLAYRYSNKILDVGGYCFSYIYPLGPANSFLFTTSHIIPGITATAATALLQPLFTQLLALGINATLPPIPPPINTRYHSRLFPRQNWDDDALFAATFAGVRAGVEAGYNFHGIAYSPTKQVAGYPGNDSAVNPAWRNTVLHGSLMEIQAVGLSAQAAQERVANAKKYTDMWRAVTPGAGAYLNEGSPDEPGWQQSFYGSNYGRLLAVKRERDPWGVFWARTTVGSEAWEVRTSDGYPSSQNGRLCRVERPVFGGV